MFEELFYVYEKTIYGEYVTPPNTIRINSQNMCFVNRPLPPIQPLNLFRPCISNNTKYSLGTKCFIRCHIKLRQNFLCQNFLRHFFHFSHVILALTILMRSDIFYAQIFLRHFQYIFWYIYMALKNFGIKNSFFYGVKIFWRNLIALPS